MLDYSTRNKGKINCGLTAPDGSVPRSPMLPAMYKRNPLMTALGTAASAPRRNITVMSEKRCATRLVTRVSNALTTVLHTRPGH